MPFGNLSLTSPYYAQWLTSEQALADFAVLVRSLRESLGAPRAPLIAFGGSYGGMLSAWFRIKYPHVVQGAIAASAPIWLFPGLTDPEAFMEITTRTYAGAGSSCAESIQKSWGIMTQMAASPAGAAQISQLFALCTPLSGVADLQNYLFPWVADALVSMAMGDYPYPTTFLGPLPANPVNASCAFFQDSSSGEQIVASLAQLMGLYGNYSGEAGPCNDIGNGDGSAQLQSQVQQIDAWGYQTCCEMVMPQSQDNVHDMFYPMPWSLQDYIRSCQQQFGTTPRPDWVPTYYGGHDIHDSTNIVFSNGNLDPWSSGGVLQNITDALPAVYILGGAHHFDLRASNAADPPSVVAARQFHRAMISQWLAESQVSH
jgi:lysosomal Pro-X carboxypeptidase